MLVASYVYISFNVRLIHTSGEMDPMDIDHSDVVHIHRHINDKLL